MAKVTKTGKQYPLAEGQLSTSAEHKSEYSDASFSLVIMTDEHYRGKRKFARTTLTPDEAKFVFASLAGFIVGHDNPNEVMAMSAKLISHEERIAKATEIVLKHIEETKGKPRF